MEKVDKMSLELGNSPSKARKESVRFVFSAQIIEEISKLFGQLDLGNLSDLPTHCNLLHYVPDPF